MMFFEKSIRKKVLREIADLTQYFFFPTYIEINFAYMTLCLMNIFPGAFGLQKCVP